MLFSGSKLRKIFSIFITASLPTSLLAIEHVDHASIQGENANVVVPDGWVTAYEAEDKDEANIELIPPAETLENWTRMISIQIIKGLKYQPDAFIEKLAQQISNDCENMRVRPGTSGRQNGYKYSYKIIDFSRNKQTNKSKIRHIKVIQDKKALYVIEASFRVANISKKEKRYWADYMRDVVVRSANK